jgi:hypothetical protein
LTEAPAGRDPGGPVEALLGHALVEFEGLAGLLRLGGDGIVGGVVHVVFKVVHFEDLDVEAELGVVHGEI